MRAGARGSRTAGARCSGRDSAGPFHGRDRRPAAARRRAAGRAREPRLPRASGRVLPYRVARWPGARDAAGRGGADTPSRAGAGVTGAAALAGIAGALAVGGLGTLRGPPQPRGDRGPLAIRLMAAAGHRLRPLVRARAPAGLAARIAAAGAPGRLAVREVMAAKLGGALAGALIAALLSAPAPGRLGILISLAGPVAGFLAPDWWLARRARERSRRRRRVLDPRSSWWSCCFWCLRSCLWSPRRWRPRSWGVGGCRWARARPQTHVSAETSRLGRGQRTASIKGLCSGAAVGPI